MNRWEGEKGKSHLEARDLAPRLVRVDAIMQELVCEDERREKRPARAGERAFALGRTLNRKETGGALA